ncbi:putative inner membrane protein [Yersinia pseudotuberculosis]|uniref:Putative inner membrane protein n=1 Tax=Yersinia similis TaxID=367190 RepID=A0A0T9RPK4_9GAMM|nr:putative inner membrane protein [Yersinia similis]CNG10446.1 putative inner membrane protein [Yersinia similis]CNI39767.1 putative inner membrane protein [Yersinia pseudotuberculosis]CNI61739.1 putative inner membrane protein [Yersinia pseudotuberculosis]CNI75634.1 putative inner membrane protein [Yersinia similis]
MGTLMPKSDALLNNNMQEAGIGEQGERLVQQAIDRPLDPQLLAREIQNEEEALELYFLSCAVIDVDHFMERSYLAALGDALKIPQDVRDGIEQDIQQQKQSIAD